MTKGGLGMQDASNAAIPAFLVPLIRSNRYAAHGIAYREGNKIHKLAPIYTKWFSTWRTARHPTPE
jgi:hypothetical protein